MAPHVQTVSGSVAPEALGLTLAHEHLLADLRSLWEPPPPEREHLADAEIALDNRGELARDPYESRPNLMLDDPGLAIAELAPFRALGGGTVVELTSIGLWPEPMRLFDLAVATGLHIVAGCGYYRARCLDTMLLDRSTGELADELRLWLLEGMYGTPIRAGLLGELGTGDPLHPFEIRQLEAAARVQRETGCAVNVHPAIFGHQHLAILDILERGGADPRRVILSHCDELVEPEWHARIAERGAVLSFDTFGSESWFDRDHAHEPRDTDRIACLSRLWEAGYGKQIVLSQDVCTRMQLRRYGGWGYDHLLRTIVPRLLRSGFGGDEIRVMLADTPARLLTLPG